MPINENNVPAVALNNTSISAGYVNWTDALDTNRSGRERM